MIFSNRQLKLFRLLLRHNSYRPGFLISSGISLAACGGGSDSPVKSGGFPKDYEPPMSNYDAPTSVDPYYRILSTSYTEPYWVQSLEMPQSELHIPSILFQNERKIEYTFQQVQPGYNHFAVDGWAPSTNQMVVASREIFTKIEEILDVSFIEVSEPTGNNVIAIATSNQTLTSGISFYPNNYYEIGMDVFIAKGYSSPRFINELTTNYDYEVLVHEIGHALGLKHPFEASASNSVILTSYEDNTSNTAMSYNDNPMTFSGMLKALDLMALTKLYGVNNTYNNTDNTYSFSSSVGTFIIDGAGVDTINAGKTASDVAIDMRPGAHSYLGTKSQYITDGNQLTISHGTQIENVVTGKGNDIVIATDVDNVIETGEGADIIFAGEGSDTIKSGSGADQIDISEDLQFRDSVTLDVPELDNLSFDTIFGFVQGVLGDILEVSKLSNTIAELLPLVASGNAPVADISGGILRVIGNDFTSASRISKAFDVGGTIEQLSMSSGSKAIIISANTQSTGEDQSIFHLDTSEGELNITQLAVLKGNSLDIDQWHIDNFNFVA